MKIQSKLIEWLVKTYPGVSGNNTKICLTYWKYIAQQRGIYFPSEIEEIIRDYKPESITRKRREVVESTKEQSEKAFKYNEHYSHRWGIKHEDL